MRDSCHRDRSHVGDDLRKLGVGQSARIDHGKTPGTGHLPRPSKIVGGEEENPGWGAGRGFAPDQRDHFDRRVASDKIQHVSTRYSEKFDAGTSGIGTVVVRLTNPNPTQK